MKGFSCIFIATVALCLCAEPKRSNLGSNGEDYDEILDLNPYITDGLVAMWDGIWNVAPGIHNSEAEYWEDLVGNASLKIPSNLSIFEDSLGTEQYESIDMKVLCPSKVAEAINNKTLTVEFVGMFLPTNGSSRFSTNSGIMSVFQNQSIRPLSIYAVPAVSSTRMRYRASILRTSAFENGSNQYIGSAIEPYRVSVVGVFNGNTLSQYIDGIHIGDFQLSLVDGIRATNSMYLRLLNHPTAGAFFNGEVCAVRIYERALEASEVEYNYMIDAERFGL